MCEIYPKSEKLSLAFGVTEEDYRIWFASIKKSVFEFNCAFVAKHKKTGEMVAGLMGHDRFE